MDIIGKPATMARQDTRYPAGHRTNCRNGGDDKDNHIVVPVEGHESTGWSRCRDADSGWNQDLRGGVNPLNLPAGKDYWITANFT